MNDDDDFVLVARAALQRAPMAMAYHEIGRIDPEWGQLTACLYLHDWVKVRRDVAELFCRPCQAKCASRRHSRVEAA